MQKTKIIDVYFKDLIMGRGVITYDDAFINICTVYLDEEPDVKLYVLYLMDMDYGICIPGDIYNKIQESTKLETYKNEGGMLQW